MNAATEDYRKEQEIVEFDLDYVRSNKRTFFDASQEAMEIALEVGRELHGELYDKFSKVIDCIATYDALVECL